MKDFENFGYGTFDGCEACGKRPARLDPYYCYAACEECYKIPPVYFCKKRDQKIAESLEQLEFDFVSEKVDYKKLLVRCFESWHESEGCFWYPEPEWNEEDKGITEAEVDAVKEIVLKIDPSFIDFL